MINFFKKIKKYGVRRAFLYFIVRIPLRLKVFFYKCILSDNKVIARNLKITQPTQFVGLGKIELNNVFIGIWPSPNLFNGVSYFEARSLSATLKIGGGTFINNNAVIIVDKTGVFIGDNCLIGSNFFATDSDFHGLSIENRVNGIYDCSPVIIENDVFIGEGVRILKGVTIGRGAVVGSGSLVTKNVAPNTVVAGVPAKKISDIEV